VSVPSPTTTSSKRFSICGPRFLKHSSSSYSWYLFPNITNRNDSNLNTSGSPLLNALYLYTYSVLASLLLQEGRSADDLLQNRRCQEIFNDTIRQEDSIGLISNVLPLSRSIKSRRPHGATHQNTATSTVIAMRHYRLIWHGNEQGYPFAHKTAQLEHINRDCVLLSPI
jgi:hypothetical protein